VRPAIGRAAFDTVSGRLGRWRELHLGFDAGTPEIVAVELAPDDAGDALEIPDLRDQFDAEVASMTADAT
jgi:hypothetical protein